MRHIKHEANCTFFQDLQKTVAFDTEELKKEYKDFGERIYIEADGTYRVEPHRPGELDPPT